MNKRNNKRSGENRISALWSWYFDEDGMVGLECGKNENKTKSYSFQTDD